MTLLSYVLSTCVEYLVFLLFLSNVPKDSDCTAKFIENCSFQSLSCVRFFETPWTAAHEASLPHTSSPSLCKHMSSESVMPSNRLILCHPRLLLPSVFPSIRVFSNESVLHKYWSFSFSISPSNEYSGLTSFRIDWFDLLANQGTQESSPTPQFKSISSSGLIFMVHKENC